MKLLFTDLDGTCVHYDWHDFGAVSPEPNEAGLYSCTSLDGSQKTHLLRLPPSTSGAQGVISAESLRLYAALRQLGVRLVIVTGARLATTLARLPFIPAADAIVCEGGGRIFYPATNPPGSCGNIGSNTTVTAAALPTAAPLVEDLHWRHRQAAAAGPPGQETLPPEARSGTLWQLYASLSATGGPALKLDANSYTTAFRVKGPAEKVAAALQQLPPGLATALNLGAADVFPATSGKDNAARYLMEIFGACPAQCAFMCDDDNDLGLAHLVAKAYLPGITAESVRQAIQRTPHHFHVSAARGVFGTEEILRLLVAQQMAGSQPVDAVPAAPQQQ